MKSSPSARQSGAVLILTLWTIVLLSMLVLVLASESRLGAELSRSQVLRTSNWADTLTAMNAAEMELLLEAMPEPAEAVEPEDEDRNPDFRFNGQPLTLAYSHPETMEVRIYDHAGKINLRNLTEDNLQLILEKMMEAVSEDIDEDEIAELLAAWGDWLDEDDGIRNAGAEDDYYLELDPPYLPRQGPLETVEEILLIRGFDRWFGAVNLEAAFTLYSESETVNLNIATREALALLPGLDSAAIDGIFAYRQEQDFTDFFELEDILEPDDLTALQSWVDFTTVSTAYTILIVPRLLLEAAPGQEEPRQQPVFGGFSKVVSVSGSTERPFVLRVEPMARLPGLMQ